MALAPMGQTPAAHHRLLIAELERLWQTPGGRLAVFMPPGSAKSTYCSSLFPAWVMAQQPHTNVIAASHTASLAENFSRKTQALIAENQKALGIGLARENAELWSTTNGCSYRAAGVGGTITGFRSDLWVIDDPVANRQQAESEIEREKTWNWFNADLLTRSKPGARGLLVQTRWHQDDLGGRIMELQKDKWRVINLPATALEDDPLGRKPGDLLWDNDPTYPYGQELRTRLTEYQANGAMRDWQALFEQDPRPGSGGVFSGTPLVVDAAPKPFVKVVRAWDFAATAQAGTRNPDWTVGVKMGVDEDKRYAVLDVVRLRGGPDEVQAALQATAAADGRNVRISIPQDPGQAGKSQVLFFTRMLSGYVVSSSPETGDKATRAMPFASQWNIGNVSLLRGPWNASYSEEIRDFPSAKKDDQVDASSRAFSFLVSAPGPIRRTHLNFMGR